VDNREGSLLPGIYAQVKFTLAQQRRSLIIPTSSLVIDRNGMQAAIGPLHIVTYGPRLHSFTRTAILNPFQLRSAAKRSSLTPETIAALPLFAHGPVGQQPLKELGIITCCSPGAQSVLRRKPATTDGAPVL
jgi:hypothetical protein